MFKVMQKKRYSDFLVNILGISWPDFFQHRDLKVLANKIKFGERLRKKLHRVYFVKNRAWGFFVRFSSIPNLF